MWPAAPDPSDLSWTRCARAALIWSHAGHLARRAPLVAGPLVGLTWGLHLVVAVSQYGDLWVDRHATVLVRAGTGSPRRHGSLGRSAGLAVALVAALAPWLAVCALALLLAVRYDARWLAVPVVLGLVVLADVGWDVVGHPVRGHRARRELEAAARAGGTVVLSLAAHPPGRGHGAAMMSAVTGRLQEAGRPAVLECREELTGWYARWGFAPRAADDAVLRRDPTGRPVGT